MDVDVGLRTAARAAPTMRGHAHACLDWTGRRIAGRVTLVPAESFRAHREVVGPHRVGRLRRKILDAELDRIHLDPIREFVHQDFGEEASLWMAWRTHRAL